MSAADLETTTSVKLGRDKLPALLAEDDCPVVVSRVDVADDSRTGDVIPKLSLEPEQRLEFGKALLWAHWRLAGP